MNALGLVLVMVLGGLGVLHFFAKDWLWERHESNLRARGIVNLERTPEWDTQQHVTGGVMIVLALLLLVLLQR